VQMDHKLKTNRTCNLLDQFAKINLLSIFFVVVGV